MNRDELPLRICLLGPLELRVDGTAVDVPGAQRRALLALLALADGRPVSTDRLVDALWPDDPPARADQALYNHVSRLRGHLRPHEQRLQRAAGGYLLRLEQDELDVAAVRRLSASGDTESALALWRGPALEDLRGSPVFEVDCVALDELQLRLVDDLLEHRIDAGDRSVTSDASAAAARAPLRERTALLLVRALATEGRTAEAMAASAAYRRRLAEETGLDPGADLAALEERVASGAVAGARQTRAPGRPDGPMVGRQHDRDDVLRLVGAHGVVTVTGPGGVGKTRLALDVATDPATGSSDTAVVDLAAVDSAERVCAAVASALGLRTGETVGPEDVATALADRTLLLLLDNCEHVVEACRALVVTMRRLASGVRVLATSRVTLHVPGEYVVRLQPLPVPRAAGGDLAALRRQPAVRAFVEHTRRVRPGYDLAETDAADVVEVIRRLDGLPLGIELAARQMAVMPPSAVRDRLDRALDLTTGRTGADDDRQRTLRVTIGASYSLLPEGARALLRALAPFPGGVDLATVEGLATAVDAGDALHTLHQLVDASLVVADPGAGRYRLLFTVRSFLLDELRTLGELEYAEDRFLARVVEIAAEIGAAASGPDEPAADRRLRAELDNLRAARDVARQRARDDVLVEITLSLDEACIWRDLRELWQWSLELASDPTLVGHPDRVRILGCAAEAGRLLGDLDRARSHAEEALRLAGPDCAPTEVAAAWDALASVAHYRGDFIVARDGWLRAREGRPASAAVHRASAALAASYGGDPLGARALVDHAHAELAESGGVSHRAFTAYVEGEVRSTADTESAIPCYLSAIEDARRSGAVFVEGVAGVALASARARTGDLAGAAAGFADLLGSWRRTGHSTQLWTTARNAAAVLAAAGRAHTAALVLTCADAQPGAAAVNPAIARHSGRVFLTLDDVLPGADAGAIRAEAERLTPSGVLDLAGRDLTVLADALVRG
ncbi:MULTISPECIES: BTAD domain-containing putative transcriptional regulator [unclassified Nocardioides]|uniref:BTAD domain-containing putative transcriptional regulator n=1 Tax=unclassified Nocardioides TaxID=2615069 RepID=UPI003616D7A2